MREKDIKVSALVNAVIHLVLTAGYRENVRHLMTYCVMKSKVCCDIAGVKGDYHINVTLEKLSLCDIVDIKLKVFIAVLLCRFVAVTDYILLEVIADNRCLYASYHSKIVINDKGKIAFSAAEIEYCYTVLTELAEGIVNNFNKAVYLLILIVFTFDNLKVTAENPQVNKSGNILPLLEDVFLFFIMTLHCNSNCISRYLSLYLIVKESVMYGSALGSKTALLKESTRCTLEP